MTSRERVRAALNHVQPDRVPTDLAAVPEIWRALQERLGVNDAKAVLDALDIDIRFIDPDYTGPPLESVEVDGDRVDRHYFGWRSRWHWNGRQLDNIIFDHPLVSAETVEDVLNYTWPSPDWFDYESIPAKCAAHEDRAIVVGHAGVYQWVTFMRGPEQVFLDMAMNPELATAMFDRCVEWELAFYERILAAGKGRIDLLRVYDDYGSQQGPLFSNEMWREYFAENTRKLCDLAHAHDAYYMQHSCGAIRPLIPELVACGVDALDPIQKVENMDVSELKSTFGERLTLHGGIDTQDLLPFGRPEGVEREARRYVELLNRDGGYILCSSQDYQADVPVENILAVYKAKEG